MRPIDADRLEQRIKKSDLTHFEKAVLICFLRDIRTLPPLTIEQLKEMQGESIWFVATGCDGKPLERYDIVTKVTEYCMETALGENVALENCGKTWTAYPYKPELPKMQEMLFRGKRLDNGELIESGSFIRNQYNEGEPWKYYLGTGKPGIIGEDEKGNITLAEAIDGVLFYAVDPDTIEIIGNKMDGAADAMI